jgi:purine-nucleoside phosphorylase
MTPHIEAKRGDYYPTVLMPGDPLRAKYIAENFLTDVVCVNTVRNCFGYSGKYKGKEVSIQASGMGQPSLGIYAYELYNFYDVQTIIRVGSCGGINSSLRVGDIVVALTASTDSSMTKNIFPGFYISPCCDYSLLKKYMEVNPIANVGAIISNDYFYQPDKNWFRSLSGLGILAVDMETHLLYSISMKNRKKSLSVNTVSDHLFGGKEMNSTERETGLSNMIESVLESLL